MRLQRMPCDTPRNVLQPEGLGYIVDSDLAVVSSCGQDLTEEHHRIDHLVCVSQLFGEEEILAKIFEKERMTLCSPVPGV